MIPQPDQYIMAYLRNGAQLDGYVVSWSAEKSVLRSKQSASIIVISKTDADVVFYRIFDPEQKTEKIIAKPNKTEDDIRSLAELKAEANLLERRAIREQLTKPTISNFQPVQYGFPTTLKPKSIPEYATKEIRPANNGVGSGLSRMFKKG